MTQLCTIIVRRWWLSHPSPYCSRNTTNWKFQILKKSKGGTLPHFLFSMGNYVLKNPKTDFEAKFLVSESGWYDFSRMKFDLRNRLKLFPPISDHYFGRYRFSKLSIFTFSLIKMKLQVVVIWNLHQSISQVKIRRKRYFVCQNWTK